MAYEFAMYEKKGHIATITMNRPHVMNAVHPPATAEHPSSPVRDWNPGRDISPPGWSLPTARGSKRWKTPAWESAQAA